MDRKEARYHSESCGDVGVGVQLKGGGRGEQAHSYRCRPATAPCSRPFLPRAGGPGAGGAIAPTPVPPPSGGAGAGWASWAAIARMSCCAAA